MLLQPAVLQSLDLWDRKPTHPCIIPPWKGIGRNWTLMMMWFLCQGMILRDAHLQGRMALMLYGKHIYGTHTVLSCKSLECGWSCKSLSCSISFCVVYMKGFGAFALCFLFGHSFVVSVASSRYFEFFGELLLDKVKNWVLLLLAFDILIQRNFLLFRPQTTIGTAMVLCHRFFLRRSHACHDRFVSLLLWFLEISIHAITYHWKFG